MIFSMIFKPLVGPSRYPLWWSFGPALLVTVRRLEQSPRGLADDLRHLLTIALDTFDRDILLQREIFDCLIHFISYITV